MEMGTGCGRGMVMTVQGPMDPAELGMTDAHNHLWIDPAPGVVSGAPHVLTPDAVTRQLVAFRRVGGRMIVDCQPVLCGRNAARLRAFSEACGVAVVAATGFHRRLYYRGTDSIPWRCSPQQASEIFMHELMVSTVETASFQHPVRAGFIKVACEETLAGSPMGLLDAAAEASLRTGAAIEVHTQRGADAVRIFAFFERRGVGCRTILCHVDKRADAGLHRELAQAGAVLEYDTFLRPQYQPEQHVWPLIAAMAQAGLTGAICLGTDMIGDMWEKGTGLAECFAAAGERLLLLGLTREQVAAMTGGTVARRLALAGTK